MLFINSNEPENYADNLIFNAQYNLEGPKKCSVFVTKGTTIYTRKNDGTYNLTCYEFK